MGYENQESRSSGATMAIIFVVVFLLLAGVAVLVVGGFLFVRTTRMQQRAMMERDRAMQAEVMARQTVEEMEAVQAELVESMGAGREAEKAIAESPQPELQFVIRMDKNGEMTADGESLALERLATMLKAVVATKDIRVIVDVRADEQCAFGKVQEVVSLCQDCGVERFRIRTLDPLGAENASMSGSSEPTVIVK